MEAGTEDSWSGCLIFITANEWDEFPQRGIIPDGPERDRLLATGSTYSLSLPIRLIGLHLRTVAAHEVSSPDTAARPRLSLTDFRDPLQKWKLSKGFLDVSPPSQDVGGWICSILPRVGRSCQASSSGVQPIGRSRTRIGLPALNRLTRPVDWEITTARTACQVASERKVRAPRLAAGCAGLLVQRLPGSISASEPVDRQRTHNNGEISSVNGMTGTEQPNCSG
jgi:hypothetical protein